MSSGAEQLASPRTYFRCGWQRWTFSLQRRLQTYSTTESQAVTQGIEPEPVPGCGARNRYGVRVLADEIHAPVLLPGADFTPYLTAPVGEDAFSFMSASKGWNLADALAGRGGLVDIGLAHPLVQRPRGHAEISGDRLDRHTVVAVAGDPHDIVAELTGVEPWHKDILPAHRFRVSQFR